MAWISPRELADVIHHAMFSQPTNQQEADLRKKADDQLREWRRDAMNFGDCACDLLRSAFNFDKGSLNENGYFGCSAPSPSSSSNTNSQETNFAMAAALMLDEVASPSKWIEAQIFSDKPKVVSILHQVAFYARPYSEHPEETLDFPNALQSVLGVNSSSSSSTMTSSRIEYKTARFALNALAGIAIAEFPNSNWSKFIYGVTRTNSSNSREPSSSTSPTTNHSPNSSNNNNAFPASSNNNVFDVPLSRRYAWMYFIAQRLANLPLSESLTAERIGLRLALLDFLESAMKNTGDNQQQLMMTNDETVLQWKLTRIFLLQLPASSRHTYPVVRSIVSEAANRIFAVLNNPINLPDSCLVPLSWTNPSAMSILRDQILLLKAAPAKLVVSPLCQLLARSIISNDAEDFSRLLLPGPLLRPSFEVILSFLEKCDEDDINDFCSENEVPINIFVRIASHALCIAPGNDEVFAVPRHKALLGSEDVNDEDITEVCSPSDFQIVEQRSKLFWRTKFVHQDSVNAQLKKFYGGDLDEYFASREASLVNDVKELDAGVTGSAVAGSLSSVCVGIIELLVEFSPQQTSHAIGQVIFGELFVSGSDGLTYSNLHGMCTLLLSAFRVFNINGSTTFAKAVCEQNANQLLEMLMERCLILLGTIMSSDDQRKGNWDAVHVTSRLLIVGCILCEGSSHEMMEKLVDSVLSKIIFKTTSDAQNNNPTPAVLRNLLVLHSSAIYCYFRLCVRSPSIRSNTTLTFFQQPETIPIFATILKRTNTQIEDADVEEYYPFSCFAISELTTCVLAMGSPDHLHQIWNSESVFKGFLGALSFSLMRGSLRVEGVVSQSLKKLLGVVLSDHIDTRPTSCMQVQTILNPIIRHVVFDNSASTSDSLKTSPVARILCEVLKELFVGKFNSECSCVAERSASDNQNIALVTSYRLPFAILTQHVALSEAEAKPTDGNVRFTSYCIATMAAVFDLSANQDDDKTSSLVINTLFVRFLKEVNVFSGNSNNNNDHLLLSRTLSTYGFAAAFCLRRLAMMNHPGVQDVNFMADLLAKTIKTVCSYLRTSTKDSDLSGIAFLIGVIGQINGEAFSVGMRERNLHKRDVSLCWSLLCTCACEMSDREFAPISACWETFLNSQTSSSLALESLDVFVLPPATMMKGSRKSAKHSIVADDFARVGKHFSNIGEAVGFVMNGGGRSSTRKSIQMFTEGCFSRLF